MDTSTKIVRWVNFWQAADNPDIVYGGGHLRTREDADNDPIGADPQDKRVACVRIEFTLGDGL